MKVLYIIPYDFIPPNSGNKTLLYALLRGVSPYVECDLAILADTPGEDLKKCIKNELPHVKEVYIFPKPSGLNLHLSRLKYLFSGCPHALGRYRSKTLEIWLCNHAIQYNLIHFDMINVAPYRAFCGSVPSLLVASDAYSMAARSARCAGGMAVIEAGYLLFKEHALRHYERSSYPLFDLICTVSDIDAMWLRNIAPTATIRTIGIGLTEVYADMPIKHFTEPMSSNKRILCTGSLNHSVVADGMIKFLRNTVSVLLREHPDLTVTILGKDPTSKLKRCMETFYDTVKHVDFIDDYAGFLDQDWIYVYPQKCGSGLQTKVQQAMALGLPVVGFEVSFGGLGVESGRHCYVCNGDADMTKRIQALIAAGDLRRNIGLAASNHVRNRFSIKRTGEEMLSLYNEVIQGNARIENNYHVAR